VRQPSWALAAGSVTVDGKAVAATPKNGYLEITREWKSANVRISFAKHIVREPLPGDGTRFALLDGPIVLAALTDKEPEIVGDGIFTPQYEHVYEDGHDWRTGHYLVRTANGTVALKPLYEVADETYCVYCTAVK
jgi:DUF1680 family protein